MGALQPSPPNTRDYRIKSLEPRREHAAFPAAPTRRLRPPPRTVQSTAVGKRKVRSFQDFYSYIYNIYRDGEIRSTPATTPRPNDLAPRCTYFPRFFKLWSPPDSAPPKSGCTPPSGRRLTVVCKSGLATDMWSRWQGRGDGRGGTRVR
ncbi:unnamed protein product [Bursaphelenchus xylophilus]|uniref:(pine wood nematode) hypothetical protein n=1 Tax=Bursaphelenchus xylophilus TaxID=6326 RepID=A0A1I7RRL1_BURXY|nr:unnamed protein product [Bursaphelenchus xylophilus]CAG9131094.1 unnamed protein product [Bursaphelenchus xylophilus]